jgi:hypothetical protein
MELQIVKGIAGLIAVCVAVMLGMATIHGEREAATQNTRDLFVGSWRLVSLEHTGPDGKIDKPDCSGQFCRAIRSSCAVGASKVSTWLDRQGQLPSACSAIDTADCARRFVKAIFPLCGSRRSGSNSVGRRRRSSDASAQRVRSIT